MHSSSGQATPGFLGWAWVVDLFKFRLRYGTGTALATLFDDHTGTFHKWRAPILILLGLSVACGDMASFRTSLVTLGWGGNCLVMVPPIYVRQIPEGVAGRLLFNILDLACGIPPGLVLFPMLFDILIKLLDEEIWAELPSLYWWHSALCHITIRCHGTVVTPKSIHTIG